MCKNSVEGSTTTSWKRIEDELSWLRELYLGLDRVSERGVRGHEGSYSGGGETGWGGIS